MNRVLVGVQYGTLHISGGSQWAIREHEFDN